MTWHGRVMLMATFVLFYATGFKLGWLTWLIKSAPNPLYFLGHGFKCMSCCFWYFIFSYLLTCSLKYISYQLIAMAFGLIPMTMMDCFWMYDFPSNPINVPLILVINKPDKD